MYNHDIKKEFIQTYNSEARRTNASAIFNQLEPYENEWNADICTVSADKIRLALTRLSGLRADSKRLYLSIIRAYARWCIDNNKVSGACEAVFEIKQLGLEKIRERMVMSPEHLQLYMDCLFDDEMEETTDNVLRCYFWLAFIGLAESKAVKVKCSQVNLARMSIKDSDDERPLPRESFLAVTNCATLTSFRLVHPIYTVDVRHDRIPGDELLRGVKSGVSVFTIREKISRRQKDKDSWRGKMKNNPNIDMNLKLSYKRVMLSGLFYRQYEIEKKTKRCPDFRPAAIEFMGDYQYKLDKSRNTIEAKERQVTANYLSDYERWKEAFSLPSYHNG